MKKNETLIKLCQTMLQDPEIVEQPDWEKLILIGEVEGGDVGMRGYSYNLLGQCLLVAPDPANLNQLKALHAAMQADNATGRGWLKCMIRISRAGEIGADFEYDDPGRWNHTPENYQDRIKEYAAMPV
ncbi:hypothetical protein [Ottowia testudinis]|uniref:Uncharacterized protein n=1 Tax=Ottowia testudinis TaxID=2816950 RepID=A0A975H334_9BURK|nr:hypothetical protein [Ottowia testudinis]QTD45483.1 hypothetical protein J1M35_00710 [Ottowia testudinis]